MNIDISVPKIRRYGAFFIMAARLRAMSKWKVIIITVDVANPIFYLVAIGIGVGVLVSRNSGDSGTGGIPYLAFIAPALLASTAILGTLDEVVFPTIEGFKWRKLFFAQNSTPISGTQIAIGVYLAAITRALFSATIYYLLLLVFNVVELRESLLLVPTAVFGGASFGALLLFFAAKAEKDEYFFTVLNRLVIMPMFLFSGTFFPLSVMPIYLQPIGWISPLWHATELGRQASYAYGLSALMIAVHLIYLFTIFAVGIICATRQFERRLAK